LEKNPASNVIQKRANGNGGCEKEKKKTPNLRILRRNGEKRPPTEEVAGLKGTAATVFGKKKTGRFCLELKKESVMKGDSEKKNRGCMPHRGAATQNPKPLPPAGRAAYLATPTEKKEVVPAGRTGGYWKRTAS